jgi:cytochrome c oxidase subunit 2
MAWAVVTCARALAVPVTLACLSACSPQALSAAQSSLAPAGEQAAMLADLLWTMAWVCAAAYVLMVAFLAWSLRRRGPTHGNAPARDATLHKALGFWIAFILLGLSILVGASFLTDRSLDARRQPDPLSVRVTGHQWWWRIEYRLPNGVWVETANELHLPLHRPVRLELRTADVIHSFWIPSLAGKMDMIPGKANHLTISARTPGWYRGQCAEFCGTQHAKMALDVKVENAAAFEAWLSHQTLPAQPHAPGVATGAQLVFGSGCALCHQIRGTAAKGRVGPDLTHLASRRSIAAGSMPLTTASLRGWIIQPQAIKPGTLMPASGLMPHDAQALARYLESLR